MSTVVNTGNGKYAVIIEDDGKMSFLRHGEPWAAADDQFRYVGLILALAQDLHEERQKGNLK